MGTGVNSQLLYTSPAWRFEFYSGVILLAFALPLNYFLVKTYGIMGATYSNVIAITVYNALRVCFIYYKYKMQPFSKKTLWTIVSAIGTYIAVYQLFSAYTGWAGMIWRSVIFTFVFLILVYIMDLTPDLKPVIETMRKKLRGDNKE